MNKKRIAILACIFSVASGVSFQANAMRYIRGLTTAFRATGLRRMLTKKFAPCDTCTIMCEEQEYERNCDLNFAREAVFRGIFNHAPEIVISDFEKTEKLVDEIILVNFNQMEKLAEIGKTYEKADQDIEDFLETLKEPEV